MRDVARGFSNLPTRWKLLLSFSLIIAALLLVIGMTLSAFRTNRESMSDLQSTQLANAIDLLTLESQLNDNRIKVYKMLVMREDDVRVLRRELVEGSEKNRLLLNQIASRNADDSQIRKRLEELKVALKDYYETRDNIVVPLIVDGQFDKARTIVNGELSSAFRELRDVVHEVSDLAASDAKAAVARSEQHLRQSAVTFTGLALLALLVALGLAVALERTIAYPLSRMADVAREVTLGNLKIPVPCVDRHDEVGQLAREFDSMIAARRQLVDLAERIADGDLTVRVKPRSDKDLLAYSLNLMAENLQGLVRELQEGAEVIQASGDEDLEALGERLAALAGALKA